MEINFEEDKKEKKPVLRSINEEFEEIPEGFIIRSRGADKKPLAKLKTEDIASIKIKPAGTLFDGEVFFELKKGGTLKFAIKKYHQEDFEELKKKLGK